MSDRTFWTPEEDAYFRDQIALGLSVPKISRRWPKQFAKRSVPALNMRKAALGLTGLPPAPEQPEVLAEMQSVKVEQNGDVLSVTTNGIEVKTLDELIERAKVDMSVWEVDKPQTRMWEVKVKEADGRIVNKQNFYIAASFKRKHGPNVKEQVEALMRGMSARRPLSAPAIVRGADDATMQAVICADPHLAKYAWAGETGWQDWDLHQGVTRVRAAGYENLAWGDSHKPKMRQLWFLGDVMHYDNPHGTTTKGTPQDRDTRVNKMIEDAGSLICELVERSATKVPTKLVMVQGNHDRLLTLAVQWGVAQHFRNCAGVEIDTTATMRKYEEWGHCLLGLTHGDTARKRLQTLMQVERKEAWGRSKVREWHHGHLHSEASTSTEGGLTIRQHLAICPPDGWSAAEGYVGAPRGMDSYLYHKDGFLRGTWRSAVLDG